MKPLKKSLLVSGVVVGGEKVGRRIGFPTANLQLARLPKIKPGVYAAVCALKGKSWLGLAYFGKRYIFGDKVNSFEVFLLNFKQNIYGHKLVVKLTHFIRGPKRIGSLSQLKQTLTKDLDNMSKDQVILVNSKDQIIGISPVVVAHQGLGKRHRAVSVFVFNQKKELLIQQRSKFKPLWPLFWSNTSCTNTRPAEAALQAAQRCLKSELNLKTKLAFRYQFAYQAKYNSRLAESEIDSVFVGITNKSPRLNRKEAMAYRWVALDKLKQDIKNEPQAYTPWFKLTLPKLVSSGIFKR